MQLSTPTPTKLSETLISALQPQTTPQRPKLAMVWHKEWDGKRERMVAHWMVER